MRKRNEKDSSRLNLAAGPFLFPFSYRTQPIPLPTQHLHVCPSQHPIARCSFAHRQMSPTLSVELPLTNACPRAPDQ